MRLEHVDQEDTGPAGVDRAAARGPLLDWLREEVDRADQYATTTMPVPGYDGRLLCRYRRLPIDKLNEIRVGDMSLLERNAQLLIEACEEILHRPSDDADPEPLEPGRITRYGDLEPILGREYPSVRDMVFAVMKRNQQRLVRHVDDVLAWMESDEDDRDDLLAGG